MNSKNAMVVSNVPVLLIRVGLTRVELVDDPRFDVEVMTGADFVELALQREQRLQELCAPNLQPVTSSR